MVEERSKNLIYMQRNHITYKLTLSKFGIRKYKAFYIILKQLNARV